MLKNGWTKFKIFIRKFLETPEKPSESLALKASNEFNLNASAKRILIVDDQVVNLLITEKCLKSLVKNAIFDKVTDGKKALDLVEKNNQKGSPYDLIFMDIQMPIMDGITAVKEIRKFDSTTPIVSHTSRTSWRIKKEAIDAGIDDYISKTIPNNDFHKAVCKWLLNDHSHSYSGEEIANNIKGKNILITDGQDLDSESLSALLKNYQTNIEIAKNGEELINKYTEQFVGNLPLKPPSNSIHNPMQTPLISNKYDIIIVDLNTPKIGGDEAIKEIRKIELIHNINNKAIIIINSDDNTPSNLHQMLRKGADDYFIKDNNFDELLQKLNFWLLNNCKHGPQPADFMKNNEPLEVNNYMSYPLIGNKLEKHDLIALREKFFESVEDLLNAIKSTQKSALQEKLEQENHEGDLAELAFISHALKGITGNIGAERLLVYTSIINSYAKTHRSPNEFDANWMENIDKIYLETKRSFMDLA